MIICPLCNSQMTVYSHGIDPINGPPNINFYIDTMMMLLGFIELQCEQQHCIHISSNCTILYAIPPSEFGDEATNLGFRNYLTKPTCWEIYLNGELLTLIKENENPLEKFQAILLFS